MRSASVDDDAACPAGAWVEVEAVLLTADERSSTLPEDTRSHDLIGRTRGFLTAPARLGDHVTVRTLADRLVNGRLRDACPRNPADFGDPVRELLEVGAKARRRLVGPGA